jgi:hypothetical protein
MRVGQVQATDGNYMRGVSVVIWSFGMSMMDRPRLRFGLLGRWSHKPEAYATLP